MRRIQGVSRSELELEGGSDARLGPNDVGVNSDVRPLAEEIFLLTRSAHACNPRANDPARAVEFEVVLAVLSVQAVVLHRQLGSDFNY